MSSGFIIIGPTEALIEALFPSKFDNHIQKWRWHVAMVRENPDYLADIAVRQAAKRAAGIGPEGRCHA